MGARILNGAVIGANCLVGAGALVTEGKVFEAGHADRRRPGARDPRADRSRRSPRWRVSAAHYAQKAAHYARRLRLHR